MQHLTRAACAIALAAASLPALAATATATRAWQFKPESNAGLAVRNFIGNVRIEPGTKGTGRIVINYNSLEELDGILARIR